MAAVTSIVLLVPAFSQTSSTGSSSGTSSSGTKTTVPAPTPSTTINSTGTTGQTTTSQPIRVSGRVVMDDGSPHSFTDTIERVCGGNPHPEGYTDSKGFFSLVLGQNQDVIADASEVSTGANRSPLPPGIASVNTGSGLSNTPRSLSSDRFVNCDLRASLGGYTSQTLNLTGRTSMDTPDIGNIVLHRMGAQETATTVTASTLKAPKEARKALQKGLDFAKKNKPEDAIASLQEAVRIDPEFAFAWFELGKLQIENGHIPDAHESFEAAAKAEPHWPEPYLHLAVMGVKAHDWKEVAETTDHVLQLSTWEYPQAYFLNGAANFNLHHLDVAEKDALSAEKVDVQHDFPQVEQLLGIIYAERHRYADAAEKLRTYLTMAPNAEDAPNARVQLGIMEKLAAQSSQVSQKDRQ